MTTKGLFWLVMCIPSLLLLREVFWCWQSLRERIDSAIDLLALLIVAHLIIKYLLALLIAVHLIIKSMTA